MGLNDYSAKLNFNGQRVVEEVNNKEDLKPLLDEGLAKGEILAHVTHASSVLKIYVHPPELIHDKTIMKRIAGKSSYNWKSYTGHPLTFS